MYSMVVFHSLLQQFLESSVLRASSLLSTRPVSSTSVASHVAHLSSIGNIQKLHVVLWNNNNNKNNNKNLRHFSCPKCDEWY